MNKIYIKISELRERFKEMCFGITQNENEIDDAVQELYLYFMQMNQQTLKNIYEKDGEEGIIRYGAVVLRRALTSPRSPFYYKYKKYYTHLDKSFYNATSSIIKDDYVVTSDWNYKNISNIANPEEVYQWKKLEKIDKILDDVYWYDRNIFKLYYYEGNTLDSLAKKTKISRNSLFTTIDKVRELIKDELDE
tara:strand:- start:121 stop:696 length:576 start_codon:yes stop_codon:yes gene_type:complete